MRWSRQSDKPSFSPLLTGNRSITMIVAYFEMTTSKFSLTTPQTRLVYNLQNLPPRGIFDILDATNPLS